MNNIFQETFQETPHKSLQNTNRPRSFSSKLRHAWRHTRKGRVATVLLVLFGLLNAGAYLACRDQTYPQTDINGHLVGSVKFSDLPDRLRQLQLLPKHISLAHDGTITRLSSAELGMRVDHNQTTRHLVENRSWLPLIDMFTSQNAPLFVAVEPTLYQKKITDISKVYKKDSVNASLTLKSSQFIIIPEVNAITVDPSGTQARIVEALSRGRDTVELMTKNIPPAVTSLSLAPMFAALQAQRNTPITINYQDKTKTFTADEVGNWFVAEAGTYRVSAAKVAAAVTDAGLELGANATNTAELTASIKQSVETKKPAKLSLAGAPLGKKTYSYCTAVRDVPASGVTGLIDKAASTLSDRRGWSLSGNISFIKSDTVCDFTIWLSAASQMPTFGAICDPMWSCAVTPNVIINYDRWMGASEAWNKQGGSLEDYRAMVINHEVGHWLGFNHSNCPAAGQAAPVMLQQSINLQGCTFNPWPSATERSTLKSFLGL